MSRNNRSCWALDGLEVKKKHCGKVPTAQEVMLLFFLLSGIFLASGVIFHFNETFGLTKEGETILLKERTIESHLSVISSRKDERSSQLSFPLQNQVPGAH